MTQILPGPPLKIAVLANLDSPHARRWLKVFVERGHDVHTISYYAPRADVPGVTLHMLKPAGPGAGVTERGVGPALRATVPPAFSRLVNALRFRRAGLRRMLEELQPDVFHGHFVVEHGFFGAMAGFHPYVVSAWGSDLYRAPRTPAGRALARYALRRADLVTGNDPALVRAALALGVPAERAALVRLGLDREFLVQHGTSANLRADSGPPAILSDRALEPLYNVDVVIRAFARLRGTMPGARLVVAHDGPQRERLRNLVLDLGQGAAVDFVGRVDQARLKELLTGAHVYVSVPSSDSLSLSTMEAMACGAFPVVSDLASQDGWIAHRVNGLRVPARDEAALARSLELALADADLRRAAVAVNRAKVEAEGDLERNMLVMERHYYRLAGRPLSEGSI